MSGINERIEKLIPALGYNNFSFCKAMGFNYNAVIQNIVGKRQSKPGYELLHTILTTFPQINATWLLTGVGEMFNAGNISNALLAIEEEEIIKAPLIGQFAYAGYMRGFSDAEFMETQPTFFSSRRHSRGNYVAFEIRGDSMDDDTKRSICEGDIVLCRELSKEYWQSKLHIPKVFIIVHKNEGIICKEVTHHDVESGELSCHSWNPDPEYADFTVNMSQVQQIFYIKEVSRKNKF